MRYSVLLSNDANQDLRKLYGYIAKYDSPDNANKVIDQIEHIFNELAEYPNRGACPKELLALGIHEYREVFFKAYRIIYRVNKDSVYVLLIADGRRDMQTLLQQRLLQP
ncbi:MAG: type II toxin-antitoxin system RelE/ParE family toxin [Pseudomonadota bacterium]|nr:type II toxin-antitoxin system RelE/ParE family toxin [Pseudomonadota bacterium]